MVYLEIDGSGLDSLRCWLEQGCLWTTSNTGLHGMSTKEHTESTVYTHIGLCTYTHTHTEVGRGERGGGGQREGETERALALLLMIV